MAFFWMCEGRDNFFLQIFFLPVTQIQKKKGFKKKKELKQRLKGVGKWKGRKIENARGIQPTAPTDEKSALNVSHMIIA
jgi:hypothetical protein